MPAAAARGKPPPMLSPEFCMAKAEECELNAAEADGPVMAREWLWMASEWRLSAELDPSGPGAGEDAPDVAHQLKG